MLGQSNEYNFFLASNNPDHVNVQGNFDGIVNYINPHSIFPDSKDLKDPDPQFIKDSLSQMYGSDAPEYLVLDLEHWYTGIWNWDTMQPLTTEQRAESIAKLKIVIEAAKDALPTTKIGFYSMVPPNEYWAPLVEQYDPPRHQRWLEAIDQLAELADHVDFVSPTLYAFYDNQGQWESFANATIEAAHSYGKPVIPFIWPAFHTSSSDSKVAGQPIDEAFFEAQLELVYGSADSVFVWGRASDLTEDRLEIISASIDEIINKNITSHSVVTEADGDVLTTTYDAAGSRVSFTFNDGSRARDWESYTNIYDENGDITAYNMIYDNGNELNRSYVNGIVENVGEGTDHVDAAVSFSLRDHSQHIETLTLTGTGNITGTGNKQANTIRGNAGNNTLNGAWGNDTLEGGAGNDTFLDDNGADSMVGGTGGDTFVFLNNFGQDVVADFDTTQSGEHIDLSAVSSITGFADLSNNHLRQSGDNTVIDDGLGNIITLQGVYMGSLSADDFLF